MNESVKCDRVRMTLVAVLTFLGGWQAVAGSGIWTGAADAVWTNSANWSAAPYPSGADEATFNGEGGGNTTIDLSGLSGIKTLTFDTAGVASYVIGAGGVAGQTLVLADGGLIRLTETVANDQRVDASVQLGQDTSYDSYTFRNDSVSQTLTIAGDVAGALSGGTAGSKTLTVRGAGDVVLSGDLSDGGASSVKLASYCEGTLTLGGANSFDGDTELYSGMLRLTHPNALNGVGRILIRSPVSDSALIELAHDGVSETPFRVAIGVYNGTESRGTLVSGVGTGSVGINHTIGELGISDVTLQVAKSADVLSGSPSITVQSVLLNGNSPTLTVLEPTTADLILEAVTIPSGSYHKVLELAGTATGSRVDGVITNGIHTISMRKSGSGTWRLNSDNVYTGMTEVTQGTLALAGTAGAVRRSPEIMLGGGTLLLDNTAVANADRIGDGAAITLAGGALAFSHAAGAADYSESAGVLTVSTGGGTILTSRAAPGQSSTLTFDSLVSDGGTVDFVGDDLGVDSRNQIIFSTPPTLTGGLIGPWATVNGTNLATYGAHGITAYSGGYTDISAKGPSTVPDDAGVSVRINSEGTSGGIDLAGATTNRINLIIQNTVYPATVSMGGKTLQATGLLVNPDMASLIIGASVGDGVLAPLSPGGSLILGNYATNGLIINASLANHSTASSLTKNGTGETTLNGAVDLTGSVVINEGALRFGGHGTPQTVAAAISGPGTLKKSGTNTLHLLGANSYTGPTLISEGLVRPDQNTTFGTEGGGVFIADGATLDIGCSADVGGTRGQDELTFGEELFTVRGTGVDGKGAIVCNAAVRQLNAFGRIALSGDASFGGTQLWRIQNNSPSITLNDHTLTKTGPNLIDLYSLDIFPGAGHIDVEEGTFRLLYSSDIHGGDTNTMTIRSGATLELYKLSSVHPPLWRLICEDGSIVRVGNQTTDADNEWAGPVTLQGALQLTAGGGYHQTFSGDISGAGSIVKGSSSTVTLSGTNNTYAGGTAIDDGTLVAASAGALPGYDVASEVAVAASAALVARTGDGVSGWDSAQLADLNANVNFAGPTAIFGVDTTFGDLIHTSAVTGALAFTKTGDGTLELSAANSFSGVLTVDGGTLDLSGSNALSGGAVMGAGTLLVSGSLDQGAAHCFVTGAASGSGMLRIASGANMTGTGKLSIGRSAGLCGALYIEGGTLVRDTPDTTDEQFNLGGYTSGGYGYLSMSGGSLVATRIQLGPNSSSSGLGIGIARISGGVFDLAGTFVVGYNAYSIGVLSVAGGTLDHAGTSKPILMGYSGGRGELNLIGGTLLNDGQTLEMRRGSGNATNLLNLCAGTLSLTSLKNTSPGIGWLNFQGGTLKATASSTAFIPTTLTGVYSYGPSEAFTGGAVIDTGDKSVTVAAPIRAPAGNGVAAITLTDGGSGYIGEPYVSIAGGGGEGAAAVATMADDGTGHGTYRVSSVMITCPGYSYTNAPTVTFLRGGTGAVAPTLAGVAIAPNVSGGLTKIGTGTLTLGAVNTYTGATTVTEGTLKLGNAAALASGSMVALNGGTLDLNGYAVTNAVSGSGTVANGTLEALLSPAGAGAVGTATIALSSATLSGRYLADVTSAGESDYAVVEGDLDLSNLILQLVDPGQLDRHHSYTLLSSTGTLTGNLTVSNAPDSRWHVAYLASGTVKLVFVDGTLIKLR